MKRLDGLRAYWQWWRLRWLLGPIMALTLCAAGTSATSYQTHCSLHGETKDAQVVLCVTRLDATHCRIVFKVAYTQGPLAGSRDHFGGKVLCRRPI